ncbi:hypothetical protein ACF09Z_00325 [Streptomyces erythrochromogenes]|uniref:hypothetical protein n=1 Tax=Streptomyces erythrochromogenes TaxID=285574 RepID=UPI0036FAD6DC
MGVSVGEAVSSDGLSPLSSWETYAGSGSFWCGPAVYARAPIAAATTTAAAASTGAVRRRARGPAGRAR